VAKDPRGTPLNIVHRDISPQNIMVRDDGVTKVVDFGIARAANRSTRTQTGTVKGKLAYMPPEQVLASSELTAQADQYSLGVVLWEMCTGRRLFRADHDVALMKMVLEANIPRLTEADGAIPPALADVVERMVQREPGNRFPSCAHVAKALDRLLDEQGEPSEESPVATFLRALGPWDVPTPQATPTGPKRNFVISLDRASPPAGMPAPPPDAVGPSVDVDLGPTGVIVTPTGSQAPGAARRKSRLPVVVGAVLGAVLLAGGAWWATHQEPPPAVVTPPVVAVEAPQPPEPVVVEPAPERPAAPAIAKWSLKTTPPGASVRLDGRPMGSSPLELQVSAGETHFLLIEKAGFRRDERELPALAGDQVQSLEVALVPIKTTPTPQPPPQVTTPVTTPPPVKGPGFLTLSTTPWTKVSVAGEVLGSTPLFKVKLPAGEHTMTLVNEGQGINTTRKVTIRAGEVTKLDLQL
jgi:serine/threonine-protein kinase